jgi:hypothetical protein
MLSMVCAVKGPRNHKARSPVRHSKRIRPGVATATGIRDAREGVMLEREYMRSNGRR